MGEGDAVGIVWDEKGSEERRQRGLSGEASTSNVDSATLRDTPAQTSNEPVPISPFIAIYYA